MTEFFRKNALIGIAEILCRVPLVFTVGYLARSVGAEVFGNWTLIIAYQAFLAGIVGLGLSSSMSRLASVCGSTEACGYLGYALKMSLGSAFVAGLLTFLLQSQLGTVLGVGEVLRWLLPVAILLTAASAADALLDAYFKARGEIGRQIAFIMTRTLAEIAGVLLIFSTGLPVNTVSGQLAAYICVVVLSKVLIYPWLLSSLPVVHSHLDSELRRRFLYYGLPMLPTVVVGWFIAQGDRLLLGHFMNKHDLGIYAFGASLAAYMVFLGYAVYPLLLPKASQLYDARDVVGVRSIFNQSQRLFLALWAAAMAGVVLWAGEIIEWTAGSEFADARDILIILCLAVGVEQLLGIYQYVFHLVKQQQWILWLNLLYAAMLGLSLTLVGYFDTVALAPWAVLAVTLLFNLVRYRLAQGHLCLPLSAGLIPQMAGVIVLVLALTLSGATESLDLYGRLLITGIIVALLAISLLLMRKFGG